MKPTTPLTIVLVTSVIAFLGSIVAIADSSMFRSMVFSYWCLPAAVYILSFAFSLFYGPLILTEWLGKRVRITYFVIAPLTVVLLLATGPTQPFSLPVAVLFCYLLFGIPYANVLNFLFFGFNTRLMLRKAE